jgi:cell division protease FtsH
MLSQMTHAINEFLGKGPRCVEAYSTARYYGKLLAWTVNCITKSPGWKTVSTHGYSSEKPVYRDIQTDYAGFESCLINGQMLVEKEGVRLVITIIILGPGSVQIEAGEGHHELVKKLVQDIADFSKEHNFYRAKKISFGGEISFLNAGQMGWDSVVLDPAMKKEIRLNTIGFLKNCARSAKYGVPPKRGIILAGEPGTGKTMICKALISEADEITCITTSAYGILREEYISDLFAIAQDLSPSIIFIEDLDFIGQERYDSYRGSPPFIALLAEMDGIAEKTAIVTVATSNCFERLDKALSERPSRFDRVFRITRPNSGQRAELVKHISEKIPLSIDVREYIVKVTNGFTPAQLQEVLHGMVMSHIDMEEDTIQFNRNDVDSAIGWINIKKNGVIGFNGLSSRCLTTGTERNWQRE